MDSDSVQGIDRRQLLGWGGLAAASVAAGGPLVGAEFAHAGSAPTAPDASGHGRIPLAARPGGAYDRFVADLAAQGRFSGVVLLSYRGRTVLSRSYGMADKESGIRNHEGVAFNLASASQPFLSVAILQLVQRGDVSLSDTVGIHLEGLAPEIAEQVNIHHLLTGTSGMDAPTPDWQRVFHSREEVHENGEQWARQANLAGVPGSGSNGHLPGSGVGLAMANEVGAECLLPDQLHDCGGVEVDHQRSSSRVEASSAATSTSSSPSFGGSGTGPLLVGATARPALPAWLASAYRLLPAQVGQSDDRDQ